LLAFFRNVTPENFIEKAPFQGELEGVFSPSNYFENAGFPSPTEGRKQGVPEGQSSPARVRIIRLQERYLLVTDCKSRRLFGKATPATLFQGCL
jgi:hypothetical protein